MARRQTDLVRVPMAQHALVCEVGAQGFIRGTRLGRRQLWTTRAAAGVVALCLRIAARTERTALEIVRAVKREKLFDALADWDATGEFSVAAINGRIARVLGVSVVFGPIRAYPDGAYDIKYPDGTWERVTESLLRALDAEVRLGVKESAAHFAAKVIRQWQEDEEHERAIRHASQA